MAALTEFHTYRRTTCCEEGAYEDVLYIIADRTIVISQKTAEGERTDHPCGGPGRGGRRDGADPERAAGRHGAHHQNTALEMEKQDFEIILSRSHAAIDLIRITVDRIRANDRFAIEELQKTNKVLRQLDRNKLSSS